VLARATGEIKDLQQFAAMVTRTLQVDVRSTVPTAGPEGFVVVVNNGSALSIESVTVSVQMDVTCRVARGPGGALVAASRGFVLAAAPPTAPPPPTPRPTPSRTIQETWTGTVTVRQIGPASSGQSPLQLSGGVCLTFLSWSATTQITDVRLPR
jgi:hypothetical protein